ncbi:MAG: type II toxin-antitoxin system VapC family toxin [Bifidobacteriaceae bacterium]|jgi:predicted nucleic acid-binding protein|nr:type II toxin-antitoxin system VapC family toxin [Bifidobacteriaceae bacterium]
MTLPLYALDTSVPLLAQGGPHPRRDACRAVLELAARRSAGFTASVELIQEFVFHRLRMTGDPELAVAQGRSLRGLVKLVALDEPVLESALELTRQAVARGRDAVHAASAFRAGADAIITTDPDFGRVPGLRALDPETLLAHHAAGPGGS